jgi:hypothetical protein
MCKVKIHLFELSAMFGFPAPPKTALSSQENTFLLEGLDRSLPAAALPAQPRRTTAVFNASEFESCRGGWLDLSGREKLEFLDREQASSGDPGMIAQRANEQRDCSFSTRHSRQTERQWSPTKGRIGSR